MRASTLIVIALVATTGCNGALVDGSDLRTRLFAQSDASQCRAIEQVLLEKLEPTVTVRVAMPEALAPIPAAAAPVLRRRAVFLRIETSSRVVEGRDARIEVGVERDAQPAPLILPREHSLALLAGYDERSASPQEDEPIRFAPAREASSLLRSLTDGIQTGYALFIVPFIMTTTLAGRDMPTIERPPDVEDRPLSALRNGTFSSLSRVLEQGGCSLVAGGGCSRWLVLPRPDDERAAPLALSFAVQIRSANSVVVRVALPPGPGTVEDRVRAVFSPNEERPLLRVAGANYTSICDRRAR